MSKKSCLRLSTTVMCVLLSACVQNDLTPVAQTDEQIELGSDISGTSEQLPIDDMGDEPNFEPCDLYNPLYQSPNADKSLLTGEPCEPPCWQGLTPGKSTREEAIQVAETSPLFNSFQMLAVWGRDTPGSRILEWTSDTELYAPSGNIFFDDDGIVDNIHVYIEYRLKMGEVVDRLGEPDAYVDPSHNRPYHNECFVIGLLYFDKGLTIMSFELSRESDVAKVQVRLVGYQAPTTDDLERFLADYWWPQNASNLVLDWQGFDAMFP